ncbi:MAG TPA: GTP cyclohydrolase I FolE [Firmicutes bacterium]|nr:GTP cyclohydrolase I FolE [Bacillota bacterium]
MDREKLEQGVRMILEAIGERVDRPGLKETPSRVAEMYAEVFAGLGRDPREELTVFQDAEQTGMIILRDIPFYSMCEHHLIPFLGRAHVTYLPQGGRLTGLSKLARVVEVIARRPQVQERMTEEIADVLMEGLKPRGVLVVIEAEHLCLSMRGINKPGTLAVSTAARGVLAADEKLRSEAITLTLARRPARL